MTNNKSAPNCVLFGGRSSLEADQSFLLVKNTLIISDEDTLKNINKSARNIKDVKVIKHEGANIYDLFKYKNIVMTSSSIKKIQDRILNEKN